MAADAPPEGIEDFLTALEDYTPTVPDDLTAHYLARCGFQSPDVRLTRLISVAAQKFVDEILKDALQHARKSQELRVEKKDGKEKVPAKEKRLVLSTEDLALALKSYGVNVRRPEYFVDFQVTDGVKQENGPEDPEKPE